MMLHGFPMPVEQRSDINTAAGRRSYGVSNDRATGATVAFCVSADSRSDTEVRTLAA